MSTKTVEDSQRELLTAGEAVRDAYVELARREATLRSARQVAGAADDRVQEQREELAMAQHHLLLLVTPAPEVADRG